MTASVERVAKVNVTYGGSNSDLVDPVSLDATDADVRAWVTEAVRSGSVPGIAQDQHADFHDFVVERFPPNETHPTHRIMLRPKASYGG